MKTNRFVFIGRLSRMSLIAMLAAFQAISAESAVANDEQRHAALLEGLRAELQAKLPALSPAAGQAFAEIAKDIVPLDGPLWRAKQTKDPAERERNVKAVMDGQAQAEGRLVDWARKAGVQSYLGDDALDDKLVKFVVLLQGTPRGLAAFAGESAAHAALIEQLLADPELMKRMLVADGPVAAREGKGWGPLQYGPAMKIYTDIQKASPKAAGGTLRNLALAIALEHAVPIRQDNPKAAVDAPEFVDPVKRYLNYEKAFLADELDDGFKGLSAWEMRLVVDGDEPDWMHAWGRETLRNFRPNHVFQSNEAWRYVGIVGSDVEYGSHNVKYDRPELQFFQNILMNGGVCGRRAFFGRFILRSFGIPTIARPSRGHAALARWTSDGWVVALGPPWGRGNPLNVLGRYPMGLDFVASTQARRNEEAFMQVKRAYWAADVLGQPRLYGESQLANAKSKSSNAAGAAEDPAFWSTVALKMQRLVIQNSKVETLGAVGEDLGEADAAETVSGETSTAEDRKIAYGPNGVITIPAPAFVKPGAPTSDVQVTKSYAAGKQVFMPRYGAQGIQPLRGGTWKDSEPSPSARLRSAGYGRYENWGLRVAMSYDGANPPAEIKVPLADGVEIELVYIKPGTFIMGGENSTETKWAGVDTPKHQVTITKGFYIGKYEVTQAQFQAIMGSNPSKSTKDPDVPVDTVNDADANDFCRKASEKAGREIRLPTEAEWEFVARAGTTTKWYFGDDPAKMGDYEWVKSNAGGKSHPVGQKKPNPWGVYDILGNVCERVSDVYDKDYYANSPKEDPTGPVQPFRSVVEYEVDAPSAGNYALTADVVTVNYDQKLFASVNGSGEAAKMALPFTCGKWQESKPVIVALKQGRNTIRVWRHDPPQKGVAVKAFRLRRE